jgi:hypothetical protein
MEAGGSEQAMSAESYDHLLQRAIESEVVSQAAREQGVTLSEAQGQRLKALDDSIRQRAQGAAWSTRANPASIELELRYAKADMLLTNLLL